MPNQHQLNALDLTKKIRERLVSFAMNMNFVRDPRLQEICRSIWSGDSSGGGLVSDIWVEGAFPAKSSDDSLESLMEKEVFSKQLQKALHHAIPGDRLLYKHQAEAIRKVFEYREKPEKPALVVQAGTGAGKTESFLLPILNELSQTLHQTGQGVRCIILYPMNALVNDQVDRLYEWLQEQKTLSMMHYTSETPQNKKAADDNGTPNWEPCRRRTREDGRLQPPDILITNYSMLEYMLCRPEDAPFFAGAALQAIVLDEAHLYTGALAAEITMLLRRLCLRCGVEEDKIIQIATSATLGGTTDDLRSFITTIFSKSRQELVHTIQGESISAIPPTTIAEPETLPLARTLCNAVWFTQETIGYEGDTQILADIHTTEQDLEQCYSSLKLIVSADVVDKARKEQKLAKLLYGTLQHSPLVQKLEKILWRQHQDGRRTPLAEIAKELWDNDTVSHDEVKQKATIRLLQLGASAREDVGLFPLIPHRLHLPVSAVDECYVVLNPAERTEANKHRCLEVYSEDGNTQPVLFGPILSGYKPKSPQNNAVLSLYRCKDCGEWLFAAKDDGNRGLHPVPPLFLNSVLDDTAEENDNNGQNSILYLSPKKPPIENSQVISVDVVSGKSFDGKDQSRLTLYCLNECPQCEASKKSFVPFIGNPSLTRSIIAETALAGMPVFSHAENNHLPANGRRLLSFSDSRGSAARLGPALMRQHEIQLLRAALVEVLNQRPILDEGVINYLQGEITRIQELLKQPNLTSALQQLHSQTLATTKQQLSEALQGGSITEWYNRITRIPFIAEILDQNCAGIQKAEKWFEAQEGDNQWMMNAKKVKENLQTSLKAMLVRPLRDSPEYVGLAEITYPGIEAIPFPNELKSLYSNFGNFWHPFLRALCEMLRSEGAITLGQDDGDDREFQQGRGSRIGQWCALDNQNDSSYTIAFRPRTERHGRWKFVENVLKSMNIPDALNERIPIILQNVFNALRDSKLPWIELGENHQRPNQFRLNLSHLALRKPPKLYQAEKSGNVYAYSVNGIVPKESGRVKEVSQSELDKIPRFSRQREEYSKAEELRMGLWAEEHSAQLSPKENRRIQDLFKHGMRNILSATTTMEVGIDIGGLSGVLMANVPPGKANYLQRAGRAGRRADGSSLVITFCRPSSPFDQYAFQNFGEYLSKPMRKPTVFLERERIGRLHVYALLLGEFVLENSTTIEGKIGKFCGVEVPNFPANNGARTTPPEEEANPFASRFLQFLEDASNGNREDIQEKISRLLLNNTQHTNSSNDLIQTAHSEFQMAIKNWTDDYNLLIKAYKETNNRNRAKVIALFNQIKSIYHSSIIETFAKSRCLPRYGFPINLHTLKVVTGENQENNPDTREDHYRLQRSGLLALREYVPGSQLVVGGKLITSRGILMHWLGNELKQLNVATIGVRGWYRIEDGEISHIGEANDFQQEGYNRQYLMPRYGYQTAAWDVPKRSFDVERVGFILEATITFSNRHERLIEQQKFADLENVHAQYLERGEIFVFNDGEKNAGFVVCYKCGYTASETYQQNRNNGGRINLPRDFENHTALEHENEYNPNHRCWRDNEAPVLRHQTLANRDITDVLMLNFSQTTGAFAATPQRNLPFILTTTLGVALKLAGAELLELDSREINVFTKAVENGHGIILYDAMPGGCGHVFELMQQGRIWLEKANQILERGNLITFETQTLVQKGYIDAEAGYFFLSGLLEGKTAQYTVPVGRFATEERTNAKIVEESMR